MYKTWSICIESVEYNVKSFWKLLYVMYKLLLASWILYKGLLLLKQKWQLSNYFTLVFLSIFITKRIRVQIILYLWRIKVNIDNGREDYSLV